MTKKEFMAEVAEKMGVPVRTANEFFDKFIIVLKDYLSEGEKVQLSVLGTFDVVERARRETTNPFTKELLVIEPKKVIKFRPSKFLKEAVDKN
ncbi:DNA-binding protein [Mycoplasmopsis californica]|uniref:DNA-binding protein n=1 Tax=Mycoplasmopsis californica TaxID=2113 RepID=A0A059XSE5_9BACT|nr:HU family DNA-binding protein [Mycoplasmopsis californica]AIA29728.1 DNA-binding protein [Mycoplasmopsis californica]